MAKKPVDRIITDYVKVLRDFNITVAQAILFGSYASGNASDESDIDVAIISPDLGRNRFSEGVMLKLLTEHVDTSISPRPYSVNEVAGSKKGSFLHDEILSKGRSIYRA